MNIYIIFYCLYVERVRGILDPDRRRAAQSRDDASMVCFSFLIGF